jgi:hypothetical protein
MHQTILGLLAAIALSAAGAAPAMACGYGGCAQYGVFAGHYAPPHGYPYAGCAAGCGRAYYDYDRLADPETQYHSVVGPAPQYYYVNQGPTYTGPGAFAPYPAFREGAVYRPRAAYRWRHHYHFQRQSYYHGRPVLRRYY